jgi:TusA-related sulfurtransferase
MEGATAIDGGDLDLASGLLVLLERALDPLPEGAELELRSTEPSVGRDLPSWCRVAGHAYLGASPEGMATLHRLRRGRARRLAIEGQFPGFQDPIRLRKGEADTRDWFVGRLAEIPDRADPTTGFSPRGARAEKGGVTFPFTFLDRDRVWAAEVAELYEAATAGQWDASRDIAWAEVPAIPRELEEALCQILTFLVENEYSALYVPAKMLPRIHPHFGEVSMFLATQMMDEARHIEAFTKRALSNGGGLRVSAAASQASLKSLLDQEDFTHASFLLSVQGEGTFLDLLRFIEEHAPDPVTAEIMRRARVDEARHARFGVAHVRHALSRDPGCAEELVAAARSRAKVLGGAVVAAPAAHVEDALAILAAGSLASGRIRAGVAAARSLKHTMHENRVKRLLSCGFTAAQADEVSTLHTPNFM